MNRGAKRLLSIVRIWRILLGLALRADRRRTLAVLVLAPVAGAATSGYGLALKWLVNAAVSRDPNRALAAAMLLVVAVVGVQLLGTGAARLRLSLQQRVGHALDRNVLALCGSMPDLAELESPEFQDRIEMLRRNRPTVVSAIGTLVENMRVGAQLLSLALLLASVDLRLLLLPLFAIPAVLAASAGQRAQQRTDVATAEPGRRRRWLLELATGAAPAKELRVFGLAAELRRRQAAAQREVNDRDQATRWWVEVLDLAGWLVFSAGFLGSIALLLHRASHGHAGPGDVVLLITVAAQLDGTMAWAAQVLGWLRRAAWATGHYIWLLDTAAASVGPDRVTVPVPGPGSDLVLDSVSFGYPRTEGTVLHDISLRIRAGSTVALVGENGAGKSTLVKLLCRLYEPTSGSISFGGKDIRDFDIDRWRAGLAAGFQDFCRYEFTAADGIGVGDLPRISDRAALNVAVDRAGARRLVDGLPDGLNSQLGRTFDSGIELSGGQWQKLAIARAVMRERPLLLVLDEPTASLDPLAEQELFDSYLTPRDGPPADRITVVVSHRFSTVRAADLIVVLEGGRIAQLGSHQDLMAVPGSYAELYRLHADSYRQPV
ncbi:MAG: ABC transporter ATP-binding protein/permease [Actinomycetota bacterium]|nr:ABC transporter ATP-binding protein/permease [Actinomycetota bacterium]MDQ2958342.1 ABC transporter ATP-binding protein/permease [Actinomycetota bacterium]